MATGTGRLAEQIFVNQPIAGGGVINSLNFNVPNFAVPGPTFARFRIDSGGGLGPSGMAFDGEVEDYQVFIEEEFLLDFGDAPDPTYPTLLVSNGASHVIAPNGPMLGFLIDPEPDGQPDPQALGDDMNALPDEDGVFFTSAILPGGVATVDVINAAVPGLLNAWIDFDGNGVWSGTEQIFLNQPIAGGGVINSLNFNVPNFAVPGPTFARFRIDSGGGLGPSGMAFDGEVEDYQVFIEEEFLLDFGDAPDPTYPTLLVSNGASHVIAPNGPMLGFLIDPEPDGQPDPQALRR